MAQVAIRNEEDARATRQQKQDRILADSSARILLECLVEQLPMYTLIAPEAINIDIDKHSPADLVCIYAPKFEAVLK